MAYFLHETKAWILIHRRMIFLILSHKIFVATKIVHRHQLFVTKTRILIINFLLSTRAYRFSVCLGTFYWSEYNFCLLLSHWFYGISISPFFSFRYLYRPNIIDFSLLSHGRGFGALGSSVPLYEQFIQENTEKFEKKIWYLGISNVGSQSTPVWNFVKKYQETYSWQKRQKIPMYRKKNCLDGS